MKASTILKRCKIPQCGHALSMISEDGHIQACAMGAIMIGLGWKPSFLGEYCNTPEPKFYTLAEKLIGGSVNWDTIVDMNNYEHKSFKEIADWLKSKGY